MIEIEGVTRIEGGRPIVDRVTFSVAAGQFCALVGSSGAGKSTTLKMINRMVAKSAGTIRIGGADVSTLDPQSLRRRIGYVIQSIGLFPHWTVAENIATVPRLLGWDKARIRARVDELIDLVRLDRDHAGRYPHLLSGGQQQRVGVARALAADPDLLLMDEPFGALDPITREALADELALIHHRTGKTILFVTHDLDMALRLADRIAIMDGGRLIQFAPPIEILEAPANAFVRDLVGRSALGLKLLAIRRVGDRVRPGLAAAGEPLASSASLADALSEMVVRRTDRLPVADSGGAILLSDIVA
ncbi:MAG TPA: ABC transporter ATP-binding protein [Stellaceae bacterium]|nr:ABC transporter ATP-binding protein [Stellaceae bacterium]